MWTNGEAKTNQQPSYLDVYDTTRERERERVTESKRERERKKERD